MVGDRVFLEVERFDRTAAGRRGQVSLATLDAEFVGVGSGWEPVVSGLVQRGLVEPLVQREVRFLDMFGVWIANNDMHLGNLSFEMSGLTLGGLTPAYDMLPMAYAPVSGDVVERDFPPRLTRADRSTAQPAWHAAMRAWERMASDDRVSPGFSCPVAPQPAASGRARACDSPPARGGSGLTRA